MICSWNRATLTALLLTLFATQAQAASVSGSASFQGQAPAAEPIKMEADPSCKALHADGIAADDVIVNANGTLKNVFVYVKEGLSGKYEAPKTPVTLDQKGCMYTPKVLGVMAGQPIEIINSDSTLHNVHALPKNSPQFNLGMPLQGMKIKKTLAKPEVMVKVKCDVHPWMASYIGVLDHPFYAVTGEDGSFEIKDLPAGTYVIEAWHEKYGTQTQSITIDDSGKSDVAFQFGV
ncbi:MAG: hypothetical protein MOGMAGMI_00955 [Candidatus Omnitrophica bacterium]|nr:hypothetical protein [Candidatus Omnitrophota bacterium]